MDKWLNGMTTSIKALHKQVAREEEKIKEAQRKSIRLHLDMGKLLVEVHNHLGKGFYAWVESDLPISRGTASRLEKVFLRFGDMEIPEGMTSFQALYVLARADLSVREKAVDHMKNGRRINSTDAKALGRGESLAKKPEPKESKDELRSRLREDEAMIESLQGQLLELEEQNDKLKATISRERAEKRRLQCMCDDLRRQVVGARSGLAA